jgi:hypothetical protein
MRPSRRKVYGWRKYEGDIVPHRVVVSHRCYDGDREMEMCLHNVPPTFVYRPRWERALIALSDWAGLGLDMPMRILHGVAVQVLCNGEILGQIDSGIDWHDFPPILKHLVSGADIQRAAHGYRITLHRSRLIYTIRRKPDLKPTP